MKVRVNLLLPNPYRDMKHYPVQRDKIDRLKQSIEQTGFWDNILARKVGDIFQLAYGHHRLCAIQELGIEEIDIPVKDISDADMVRIMALENREQEDMSQSILIETVRVVRDFLNAEIKKYDTWEQARINEFINTLFENAGNFSRCKESVGQTTILKFLGGGWKQWKIQSALDTLNAEDINMDAITTFQTTGMAEGFKKAIRSINKEVIDPIPLDKQAGLAEKVKQRLAERKDGIGKTGGADYYSAIKDIVKEESIKDKYITPKKRPSASRESVLKYETHIAEIRNKADDLGEDLHKLLTIENEIGSVTEIMGRKLFIMSLNTLIKRINLITNRNEQTKNDLRCIGTGF